MEVSLHFGILAIPPVIGGLSLIAYFEAEVLCATIFGYATCWYLIHHSSIIIWNWLLKLLLSKELYDIIINGFRHIVNPTNDPKGTKQTNLKRLLRSQIYCLFAGFVGIYLLIVHYQSWPLDLLFKWTTKHDIVFQIAAAHWVCSLVEDILTGEDIVKHRRFEEKEFNTIFAFYFYGLVAHHVITFTAYMWCVQTKLLSGLCVFGLLFEVPVLVLNVRDLLAYFEVEFILIWKDYMDKTAYNKLLCFQYTLWHTCRTLPCLLYPLSLVIWRKQLATVPLASRIAYHVLGCLFGYVNFTIMASVLMPAVDEDKSRLRQYRREYDAERGIYNAVYSDDEVESNKSECCEDEANEENPTENGMAAPRTMRMDDIYPSLNDNLHSKPCPPHVAKQNDMALMEEGNNDDDDDPSVLSMTEVEKHNSPHDLWIIIDDVVYDVTNYHTKHPGTSEVLLQVGGTDATTAFQDVGHSARALKTMREFEIGRIKSKQGSEKVTDGEIYSETSYVSTLPGAVEKKFDPDCHYYLDSQPMLPCCAFYLFSFVFFVGNYKHGDVYTSSSNFKDFAQHFLTTLLSVEGLLIVSTGILLLINICGVTGPTAIFGTEKNSYSKQFCRKLGEMLQAKTHMAAICLVIFCVVDYYILTLFKHDNALRCFRVSLEISFFLEIYIRKATRAVARRQQPASVLYTEIDVAVLFVGGALDLFFLWYDLDVPNGSAYWRVWKRPAFLVIVILLFAGWIRIVFMSIYAHALKGGVGTVNTTSNMIYLALLYSSFLLSVFNTYFGKSAPCLAGSVTVPCGLYDNILGQLNLCNLWSFLSWTFFIVSLGTLIKWSSSSFAMKSLGISTFVLTCVMGHFDSGYFAFFIILKGLGYVSTETYDMMMAAGENAPKHLYPTKQIEYVYRSILANFIGSYIAYPLVTFSSNLLPDGQVFVVYLVLL